MSTIDYKFILHKICNGVFSFMTDFIPDIFSKIFTKHKKKKNIENRRLDCRVSVVYSGVSPEHNIS